MNVMTELEILNHILVATQMGHYPQLNLGIVCRKELAAWFRDKSFPDLLAIFIPHRNIL